MALSLGTEFDDPKTQGMLALGLGLLGSRGSLAQSLAQGGQQGLLGYQQARQIAQQRKTQDVQQQMIALQLQQAQQAQAQQAAIQAAQQRRMQTPEQAAMGQMPGGQAGPTMAAAAAAPTAKPGFDLEGFQGDLMGIDYKQGLALRQMLAKDEAPLVLAEGARAFRGGKEIAANPKGADLPTSVREFEYGQRNPEFNPWQVGLKRAGATNVGMPRIEVKMGDSVAGQIGPMAKDSRTQAQGAVGMFDSAERIQKALDSGKVSAGPLTTQINTVKQLVQKVGGGSDEGIRQTRQVIKSLAQMSVEARKELAGQGAVTENEAAAVAKAESGDINDLTTGELQDLVTLTKRAAHLRAKSHQGLIDSMGANEGTRGTVPFYQVRGMDRLLQHSPGLPQIGGKEASSSFDDAEKERRYQAWKQQQGRP